MQRILLLMQGPVYDDVNGYSTLDALRAIAASRFRDRLHVACAVWDDEQPDAVAAIRELADVVVACRKPSDPGSGNRNMLRAGVTQGLRATAALGFRHVLKTRTDFLLSEQLLGRVVALADADFARVLTTNVYTRFEPFHVSDMLLFTTVENMGYWFDPRPVFYEDAFAPEVQFARVFVRNRRLAYTMRLDDYLRFLRDWIELIDFAEAGIVWFKHPRVSRRLENRSHPLLLDRDGGPILGSLIGPRFVEFLRRTRTSPLAIATLISTCDPLARVGVLGTSWLLERVLRMRARHLSIPLPGGRTAQVKFGFAGRRHSYYTVAPDGPEYARSIDMTARSDIAGHGRPRERAAASNAPSGAFAVGIRRDLNASDRARAP